MCITETSTQQGGLSVHAFRETRNRVFLYFLKSTSSLPDLFWGLLHHQPQAYRKVWVPCIAPKAWPGACGHLSALITLGAHIFPADPTSAASFPAAVGQTEILWPSLSKGMTWHWRPRPPQGPGAWMWRPTVSRNLSVPWGHPPSLLLHPFWGTPGFPGQTQDTCHPRVICPVKTKPVGTCLPDRPSFTPSPHPAQTKQAQNWPYWNRGQKVNTQGETQTLASQKMVLHFVISRILGLLADPPKPPKPRARRGGRGWHAGGGAQGTFGEWELDAFFCWEGPAAPGFRAPNPQREIHPTTGRLGFWHSP